ncbi:MAG: T9SS type A sorting domain-containing protein [Bacteroidia bacterium]|nr:T9SS type A sorting domain-containing protein [Bacteroidia bacterium]
MLKLLRSKYSIYTTIILLVCAGFKSPAQNWQMVKSGFSREVVALSYDSLSNSLFVGGFFKFADTITCDGLVNWDGSRFNKMNTPISNCGNSCGPAGKVVRLNNRLFLNGYYGPYNGKTEQLFEYVNNNWVVSGNLGIHGGISNLEIVNGKLFALGVFDSLSGKKIQSLAVFNGIDWDSFNTPSPILTNDYWFKAAAYYKGQYYFGGNFTDGNFKEILRWTGSQWLPLQTGIAGGMADVTCMKVYKGILYVGGLFYETDGNSADCLVAWDGQKWYDPFPDITFIDYVNDLKIINDELYISGNYIDNTVSDSNMYVLARYNGCDLSFFGGIYKYPDYDKAPRCIEGFNGRIYAAVNDSFLHKSSKYLVSIPEATPNYKSIQVSHCETVLANNGLSIFPNPYTDNITITLPNDFVLSETKFVITNALGQVIFTECPKLLYQSVNLSFLSSAMYFFTIQDSSHKKTFKLIKN